jgi:2,3-dihydroxy-2,3-dihydro-p-cumate dehydrogenase
VNTVAPSYLRTPEPAELFESGQTGHVSCVSSRRQRTSCGTRPGDPADVAFLASADSRFVTGQTNFVNGGSSMR